MKNKFTYVTLIYLYYLRNIFLFIKNKNQTIYNYNLDQLRSAYD